MALNVYNQTDYRGYLKYKTYFRDILNNAAKVLDMPKRVAVSVIFVNDEQIQGINRDYRNIDRPTDVLSFPMIEYGSPANFEGIEEDDSLFNPETGELLLGDIMISVDKVFEQAEQYGLSCLRELAFLVAHSMLHLFGYDHMEEDERLMLEEKQRQIMEGLGIARNNSCS